MGEINYSCSMIHHKVVLTLTDSYRVSCMDSNSFIEELYEFLSSKFPVILAPITLQLPHGFPVSHLRGLQRFRSGPRAFGETLHGYFAADDPAENHLFVSYLMLLYFSAFGWLVFMGKFGAWAWAWRSRAIFKSRGLLFETVF